MFISDGAGFGIKMEQALNAAQTQDITRAQHSTGRLSAFPSELLEAEEPPQTAQDGSATGVEQRPRKGLNEKAGCAVITARADQMKDAYGSTRISQPESTVGRSPGPRVIVYAKRLPSGLMKLTRV